MNDDKEIVFPKVRDNILSVILEFFCLITFNSSSKIRMRSPNEDLKLKRKNISICNVCHLICFVKNIKTIYFPLVAAITLLSIWIHLFSKLSTNIITSVILLQTYFENSKKKRKSYSCSIFLSNSINFITPSRWQKLTRLASSWNRH